MSKKKSIILLSIFNILGGSLLQKNDIITIYEKYVKAGALAIFPNHFNPLPLEKNSTSWRWEGKDLPRVIALLAFEECIKKFNVSSRKGLAINGKDPEWLYIPHEQIRQIDYEKDPLMHDLHSLNLDEKNFDFVMVNQTLEHVYDPIRCLKNIYNHMRVGGVLYFNVPANTIQHDTPFHFYTGFTPTGIGSLVKAAGFKILEIGQWGNKEYMLKMHETNSWPDYRGFENLTHNDPLYPVIVWVFAIKEGN